MFESPHGSALLDQMTVGAIGTLARGMGVRPSAVIHGIENTVDQLSWVRAEGGGEGPEG